MRARPSFWTFPRKENLKEFLHATAVADLVLRTPDVCHLHAHFCHAATTVTWLASIITGIPFSFTAHAKDIYCEALNPAGLLQQKMDAARFVVTCTEANRQYLQKLSKTKVHCIYHGLNIDLSLLLDDRPQPSARNGYLRALAVGRLVPKKGFDVFVEACGILKRHGIAFEAVIVGPSDKDETEYETEIKKRIAKHQLDNQVRLVGPLSQKALFEEYRRASAFCLPCRVLENGDRDGIPNVLPEAMACGVPVVSTAVSGIPEIVTDSVSGLLVPPDNPEALADALLRLNRDPVLAEQLSCEARKVVRERFDGEKFACQLADLFRDVTV
jgi:glycosyltransferase involved in cell wall biosynthesis